MLVMLIRGRARVSIAQGVCGEIYVFAFTLIAVPISAQSESTFWMSVLVLANKLRLVQAAKARQCDTVLISEIQDIRVCR